MQRFQLLTVCAIALALANLLGACDDGPTRPSPSSGPPSAPPAVPVTNNVVIVGPDTVPPGQRAQYSAIAHQSDGSTQDVTNEAVWQAWNPSVLTISPTGLATGGAPGDSGITVNARGRSSSTQVIVVPAGTYRLAGTVTDAGVQVVGARVEVTGGTGRWLAATDSIGGYRFYGVGGDIEVRVTRDGYQEQRKQLQVSSHQTLDFDLILSRPRDEVSGTYTLTVTAGAECRAALPEAAMIRTYTAVLRQDGPQLTVTLEGSKFFVEHGRTLNSFRGIVEPNHVTFQLRSFDEYYGDVPPDVLEELTTPTLLAVSGSAVTTVSPAGLSGKLNGPIETLQRVGPGSYRRIATCFSAGHRFVLSR